MTTLAVISEHESFAAEFRAQFDAVCFSPAVRPYFGEGHFPDAFVLDVQGDDSVELVAYLATTTQRPIVVLGGEMRPALVSAYLESGADAVMAGGGGLDECVARLRALTRRAARNDGSRELVFRAGGVTIYPESRRVLVEGVPVRLTRTEFNLLAALAQRLDEVVTHRSLMSEVWGPEYLSARHYLRVYVRRLREKIEANPDRPALLVAQRGKGYMLRTSPDISSDSEGRVFT